MADNWTTAESLTNAASQLGQTIIAAYATKNQADQAQQNFEQSKDVFQYQKDLQSQIFAREDNSVQRRVADLKAAGLNPLLATGQSAGTGAAVPVTTPQRDTKGVLAAQQSLMMSISGFASILDRMIENDSIRAHADLARVEADIKGEKLQQEKLNTEFLGLTQDWRVENASGDRAINRLKAELADNELEIVREFHRQGIDVEVAELDVAIKRLDAAEWNLAVQALERERDIYKPLGAAEDAVGTVVDILKLILGTKSSSTIRRLK